jgi:hypothetical protein
MRSLKLVPALQEELDQLLQRWQAPTVGVHVRRTDLWSLRGAARKLAADKRLLELLWREPADVAFFVAADNPQTIDMLRGFFGARILQHSKQWRSGFRRTSVADAVLDLYGLSRTMRLIGTRRSTFSQCAALIGDIPVVYA